MSNQSQEKSNELNRLTNKTKFMRLMRLEQWVTLYNKFHYLTTLVNN